MHKIIVEGSKWSQEKGEPYNIPVKVSIARVDLDDDEQVEEFDDRKCPHCTNDKDVFRVVSRMEEILLAVIYHCPCAHIWHKELQEEVKDEVLEEVDET